MSSVLQPMKVPLLVLILTVFLVGIQAQDNSTEGTGTEVSTAGNSTAGNTTEGNGTAGNSTEGNGTDGNGMEGNSTAGNGTAAGNATVVPCALAYTPDWQNKTSPNLYCRDPSRPHCNKQDQKCYEGISENTPAYSINV